jgi:hypothetical protein
LLQKDKPQFIVPKMQTDKNYLLYVIFCNKTVLKRNFMNIDIEYRTLNTLLEYSEISVFGNDERRFAREKTDAIVDYQYTGKAKSDYIRNICTNGLYIETYERLTQNEKIIMTFTNPQNNKPAKVTGRIMWSNQKGAGIKFEGSTGNGVK